MFTLKASSSHIEKDNNWNRLYRRTYSKKNWRYCSSQCLFFKDEKTPIQLDFKTSRLIQQRLMRFLHVQGFTLKKNDSYSTLLMKIDSISHVACSMGPLDENHFCNPKHYFSVSNLIE